ncbi:hypothetical protein CU097_005433 [Rhizopus azygosporus]|uniref:Sec39 domain-containing protein n=1 Tax=Rhizopus azygosporus TaxID=86630 RepID=A0A367J7N1_RHIAZ|nr:hypothetical protein CU097_005433 [Rhizopus azygosporus]
MDQSSTQGILIHLNQGNYQAALDLATELSLDKTAIYKAQWSQLSRQKGTHIQESDLELLTLVKDDDAWVAVQCLNTVVDEPNVQKKIIKLGKECAMKQTEAIIAKLDPQYTPTTQELTWLRTRHYFLQYSDRLETIIKIWPSLTDKGSFAEAYSQFRDCNLIALAIESAREENNIMLDALFMHHGKQLLPYRLFILSQIPETADPSSFDLPHVTNDHEDPWLQEPWRSELDVVEQDWVQDLIRLDVPEKAAYLKTLHDSIQSTDYPTSLKVIADWYMERADAADAIGLSTHALEISRYAQVMGVTGIESKLAEYEWLCKYVYSSNDNRFINLSKFRELSNYEVLEGLLHNTSSKTIIDDMLRLALPWIEVCKSRKIQEYEDEEKAEFLLHRWLLGTQATPDHLDRCCLICEHSKPTLSTEDRVIKDNFDLSRLVLSIIYSSDGSHMEYLVRLFECLPIFSDTPQQDKEVTDMATILPYASTPLGIFTALQEAGPFGLTKMMDTLQGHLSSAEMLARYHTYVPLRWYLEDQPVSSQRQLCIRIASQAAGGVESGGARFDQDDDWRELLDDMLRLQDGGKGVFGKLDSEEVLEVFFSSLLRCGRFKLAKELILGRNKLIDITKAEKLVIDAEREFFDNATSGDMYSGDLKQAWDCLKILPPTTQIKKEMGLIEAAHTLIAEYRVQHQPGISLMPIQIRQSSNRLEFISKLLNIKRDIYNHHEKVLQLVTRLGYNEDDTLAKVKAISMLASAALVEEDYLQSYKLCQIAVEMALNKSTKHPKAYNDQVDHTVWQICFNLGKLKSFDDVSRRLNVLSMAMSLSPAEHLRDVLAAWRELDATKPSQIDLAQLDADRYETNTESASNWQGLLQNATKQWSLGDLLAGTSGEQTEGGKRKRDIVRNVVGSWLF